MTNTNDTIRGSEGNDNRGQPRSADNTSAEIADLQYDQHIAVRRTLENTDVDQSYEARLARFNSEVTTEIREDEAYERVRDGTISDLDPNTYWVNLTKWVHSERLCDGTRWPNPQSTARMVMALRGLPVRAPDNLLDDIQREQIGNREPFTDRVWIDESGSTGSDHNNGHFILSPECNMRRVARRKGAFSRAPESIAAERVTIRNENLQRLSANICTRHLELEGCEMLNNLPENLVVETLNIEGCPLLEEISGIIATSDINIVSCRSLRSISIRNDASVSLSVSYCRQFESLPDNLAIGSLEISDCRALTTLPSGLSCMNLTLRNCPNLTELPSDLYCGTLIIYDCPNLQITDEYMENIGSVSVSAPS